MVGSQRTERLTDALQDAIIIDTPSNSTATNSTILNNGFDFQTHHLPMSSVSGPLEQEENRPSDPVQAVLRSLKTFVREIDPVVKRLQKFAFDAITGGSQPAIKKPSAEPTVTWSIYNASNTINPSTRKPIVMGIIFIDTFTPDSLTALDPWLRNIRGVIMNNLKETDVLLFDVRGNPGGYGALAEGLQQFFTPNEVARHTMRMMNSDFNRQWILNTVFNETYLAKSLRAAQANDTFAPEDYLNTVEEISKFGMIYAKPVGLLVDGNCYSACDIFASAMQDSGAATIFGHDSKTGAGGASVLRWSFISRAVSTVGPQLPLNQDITYAFQQLVRGALHAGRLIEGFGIDADYMARPTLADLAPSAKTFAYLDFIANTLRQRGNENGKSFVYACNAVCKYQVDIQPAEEVRYVSMIGKVPSFNITHTGLDIIDLYMDSVLLNRTRVTYRTATRTSMLMPFQPPTTPGLVTFRIDGYAKGIKLFQAKRYVRFLPNVDSFLVVQPANAVNGAPEYPWDFSSTNTSWATFSNEGTAIDGWYHDESNDVLRIGYLSEDGNVYSYQGGLDARATLFVDTTNVNTVNNRCLMDLDLSYDTEPSYDWLEITATEVTASSFVGVDNSRTSLLMSRSGKGSVTSTLDLARFCGKRMELAFRFVSDSSVSGTGAVVKLVRFRAPRR
ncbi:hypothetical protein HK102_003804 [Quaeritorhiza haematococci]|nr:hypothetical protein HK102_003804 [Quaeritorhiza haematococci]